MKTTPASLIKFCGSTQTQIYRNLKRLTDDEIDVLVALVIQLGKNYEIIAEEMKRRFKKEFYGPMFCKLMWEKYSGRFDWGCMQPNELSDIYPNYKRGLITHRRSLWQKLYKLQKRRPMQSMKNRFYDIIDILMKSMVAIYADGYHKAFCMYLSRIIKINIFVKNVIFYLSQYNPSPWQLEDSTFSDIYNACRTFVILIEKFMELQFYTYTNLSDLVISKVLGQLPEVKETDFSQTAERIILLDTLCRIAMSVEPYVDQFSYRSNLNSFAYQINEQDLEVPERPNYVPYDLHRNIENRTSNTDWYKKDKGKKWIRNRFFPQLNMNQRHLILNSSTMERLIPIISKLKDIS